jgi:phosphatidylserine/phosphatidylglycerophosphate/cardiolipin synthase-like enzyme
MAKFLDTTGVSYHLQLLMNDAKERLLLISPFLKINDRLKQSLENLDRLKIDVRVIYGKNDLEPTEQSWLKSLRSVRTLYCQNLHAKCYLNEKAAIITSMNLYEYSQINNNEMGILVDKVEDPELYQNIYDEAMRLVRTSDEIQTTVAQVPKIMEKQAKLSHNVPGYCIRCHTENPLDPMVPYCRGCYAVWKQKGESNMHEEKFCHICGKPNKSSLEKPACIACFKANKDKLKFPLPAK